MKEEICQIARRAGAAIMTVYGGAFDIETKGDDSPLTAADRVSHEAIDRGLRELTPDIPILSEEGKEIPFAVRQGWDRFWLVDPLDGTKEFIKRNGEFTVNIALVERGYPSFGVVYVPAQDRLFLGGEGIGAWVREGEGNLRPIRVRPAESERGLTVVMSRSHPSPDLDVFLQGVKVAEALSVGSSLKLCAVAEGMADLYPRLGPTMEWDTAAGQAVVEGAGGRVLTLERERLRYNKENLLNPYFLVEGQR